MYILCTLYSFVYTVLKQRPALSSLRSHHRCAHTALTAPRAPQPTLHKSAYMYNAAYMYDTAQLQCTVTAWRRPAKLLCGTAQHGVPPHNMR